jgi:hypothetical protein
MDDILLADQFWRAIEWSMNLVGRPLNAGEISGVSRARVAGSNRMPNQELPGSGSFKPRGKRGEILLGGNSECFMAQEPVMGRKGGNVFRFPVKGHIDGSLLLEMSSEHGPLKRGIRFANAEGYNAMSSGKRVRAQHEKAPAGSGWWGHTVVNRARARAVNAIRKVVVIPDPMSPDLFHRFFLLDTEKDPGLLHRTGL